MRRYQINKLIQYDMQEYNKKNLVFLAVIAIAALTTFFTVVLLTYAKGGLWSAPLPVVAVGYGIYSFVKNYLPKNE